jgi:hypothetical protein
MMRNESLSKSLFIRGLQCRLDTLAMARILERLRMAGSAVTGV